MFLRQIEPPVNEPVTLDEAKLHLKIDIDDDNELIEALITASWQAVEKYLRRSIMPQTWELVTDYDNGVVLPYPPVLEIVSVATNGHLIDPDKYHLIGENYLKISSFLYRNLVITYQAGYEEVPGGIKLGILMLIAHLYENRAGEPTEVKYNAQVLAGVGLPPTIISILYPYRVVSF